jgi:signal peptidase I
MIELVETMDAPNTKRAPLPGHVLEAVLEVWGQAGEQHFIPITGNSMLPLIQDGDHVLVAHGCAGVRRGDVVVFRRGDRLIAHRVLCICDGDVGPTFITKGDHAPQFDPPLSADEIVGRVLAVERGSRYMSLDTAAWRVLGWLMAVGTLAWTKLYGWSRDLKQRLLGPQPNRLTAFLRHSALAFFSLILKVVQAVVCRWKGNVLS